MEAMLGQSRRGVNPRSGQVTVQTQPPLAEQETNTTLATHPHVFLEKAECVRSFSTKLEDDRIPGIYDRGMLTWNITGLAIDKEHMFVVDRVNNRTKVFTHGGQFKFDIKVNKPCDVAVSQTGHLYITSYDDSCVQVYSTRGQQVTTMGRRLLESPWGITLNRQGHVMVCDRRKKSIFTFHADSGQLLNTIPLSMCGYPEYITVNSVNDNIVISEWGHCVHVLSPTGDHLYKYGSREGSELWEPLGVCTDSYGHIFIADYGNDRIVALSPQGQFIRYIVTKDDGLKNPWAVVINPATGQLVVGEYDGNVKTFQYIDLKQGEFNERLRRLCESGKIPVYRQRVAIVGPYGVGKTYLAKHLIHEEYIKEEDANTTGVNIYRHRCVVHKAGRSCWIRGKDDPKDQFAQNMAIGVQNSDTFCDPDLTVLDQTPLEESPPDSEENINNILTNRAAPPDDSESSASPDKAAAAPPDDRESPASPDRAAVAERDHLDDIDKELLEKIEKIAQGEDVEPEKQVTIWDFAGQDVYYTTHQTFLSERIIYLLVFRLDQDLDDKIRVYRGEKTLKEFIMFWLNSIHMHTIGKLREEDKNAMPYVLIIGTHKDMLCAQGDVEKIFDKLKKCLDDKQVLKDHVYQYFAVSNLAEDDGEFTEIKRAIEDLCGYSSNSIATVQHLSVSWIKLEMNLAEKSEENPIITIEKLREMAQRVGLPDEELQEKFIPYHHRQGDILHFKVDGLENVVIIDPLWLAVVFSAIMTTASSQPGGSHFDLLKDDLKRGVLKEEVFDEYLKQIKMAEKKTEIIQLMLHFDLMLEISQSVENPLPGSGKRRFVVPSMLVSNNSANNALSETDPQKYLLIAFPHILFPTGLFHRLIVRLLRKYRAQDYEHNIPVVGFDHASFRMVDKQSVLHLAIEEKAMRMMITNATGHKTKPHIYLNARKTVDEELSTLRETYCPRMQFEFRIRVNNKGKDIAIKAEDVQENEICRSVEGSENAIDMTPYRIWFSDSAQAVQTSEPGNFVFGSAWVMLRGASGPNVSFIHTQRFTRLHYLVIELGTKAIKTFFLKDVVRPGITDGGDISDNNAVVQFLGKKGVRKELEKLKKTKAIYDSQWNLLYPASGHTDVETFDITLLVLLIRNLHPDKANLKWPKANATTSTPPQTTQGFIEHIQRLKNVRNFLQHSAKYGIQDMEKFRTNWEIAGASVLALGADPKEVEKIQEFNFSLQEIDTIVCEIRSWAEDNKRHFDSRFDRLELVIKNIYFPLYVPVSVPSSLRLP